MQEIKTGDSPTGTLDLDEHALFQEHIDKFSEKHILVIGDIILDTYMKGDAGRISPEAPVVVLRVKQQEYVLGGCTNTAHNIVTVGGHAKVGGIIGDDENGRILLKILQEKGIDASGIIIAKNRPTIQKTRFMGKNQQMLRSDVENTDPITDEQQSQLFKFVKKNIAKSHAVIISDYAKGVVTEKLCQAIIRLCREHNKPLIIDPRPEHRKYYVGAYLITPNFAEAKGLLGTDGEDTDENTRRIGEELVSRLESNIIITRGPKGMAIFCRKERTVEFMPTKAIEVFDVSGAGDTVVAIASLCIATGMTINQSARLANHGAGIVVGKIGTATVSVPELRSFSNDRITRYLNERNKLVLRAIREENLARLLRLFQTVSSTKKSILLCSDQSNNSTMLRLADNLSRETAPTKGMFGVHTLGTVTGMLQNALAKTGKAGDLLLCICSDKPSSAIINTLRNAKKKGITTVVFKTGATNIEFADAIIHSHTQDSELTAEIYEVLMSILQKELARSHNWKEIRYGRN